MTMRLFSPLLAKTSKLEALISRSSGRALRFFSKAEQFIGQTLGASGIVVLSALSFLGGWYITIEHQRFGQDLYEERMEESRALHAAQWELTRISDILKEAMANKQPEREPVLTIEQRDGMSTIMIGGQDGKLVPLTTMDRYNVDHVSPNTVRLVSQKIKEEDCIRRGLFRRPLYPDTVRIGIKSNSHIYWVEQDVPEPTPIAKINQLCSGPDSRIVLEVSHIADAMRQP